MLIGFHQSKGNQNWNQNQNHFWTKVWIGFEAILSVIPIELQQQGKSFKQLLETTNLFKKIRNWDTSFKQRDREFEALQLRVNQECILWLVLPPLVVYRSPVLDTWVQISNALKVKQKRFLKMILAFHHSMRVM